MRVPAVCDQCSSIFPSPIEADNVQHATFSGVSVGPCPKCGGQGHIPDGVYNFVGSTIELLSGPQTTVSHLQRLAQLVEEAKSRGATSQEVSAEVAAMGSEFETLSDLLPKNRTELYAFLTLLLAVITLLLSQPKEETPKIEIDQVVNISIEQSLEQTFEQAAAAAPGKLTEATTKASGKVGRNDPCPCGSGKKYKRCHLGSP